MIADAVASRHARILVVEDEPLVRTFNADLLSDAGYDVLEAGNAAEALKLLESIADIQLVFTDVEMPGTLDGFELAERIEARWPSISVLVTSGRRYPSKTSNAAAMRCFIPKPFRVAQLVELVETIVHRKH